MITKNGKKLLRILTTFNQQALAEFSQSVPVALATLKDMTNADINISSAYYYTTYTEGGITYYRPIPASTGSMAPSTALTYSQYNKGLYRNNTFCLDNTLSNLVPTTSGANMGNLIMLGDGTTAPTEDDYALESPLHQYTVKSTTITPSLSYTRITCYVDGDYSIVRYMCYNNINYDISFSELGIFNRLNVGGNSSSLVGLVLLGRWVFNTITVHPGESIEILLKIPIPSLT